jgi:hypothetical protein
MILIRTIMTILAALLVAASPVSPQNTSWLSYEPTETQLEGRVVVAQRYGPPNYGERPKKDAKVRVPMLILAKAVNVRGDSGDGFNSISERNVKRIQLVFEPGTSYKQFVGRYVRVKGTLFHAHTGHHYTKVVMSVASILKK